MNWDAIAALTGVLSFLASIIVAVYFYGRMTKAQDVLVKIVDRHDTQIDDHERRISHVEGRLDTQAHGAD